MYTQEVKDFQGRYLCIDKNEKWTRWPKNCSVSWSVIPIAYILVFYLIQVQIYKIIVLYYTSHLIQACFRMFFPSALKFVFMYVHPVINNCVSFHDDHACLYLCLSDRCTYLLGCVPGLSVLLQIDRNNRQNSILKEN